MSCRASQAVEIWWKTSVSMPRSEEHTSELHSQSNLVCRLLLEKKKKKPKPHSLNDKGTPRISQSDIMHGDRTIDALQCYGALDDGYSRSHAHERGTAHSRRRLA